MKAVAFDDCGFDPLAMKYRLEGVLDGGGAGARRAGDRNDGMFDGH